MQLRPYQVEAVQSVFNAWQQHNSVLAVMPTGTGKTVVLAEVIKNRPPGKAMLIAHREELIWQGANKIEAVTGVRPEIEMAEMQAAQGLLEGSDIVVSSVQTQNSGEGGAGRMTRFNPFEFSMLIVDEAHHAVAKTYRKVIDYFRQNPALKVLGVTATPDRADEKALGLIFETPAFEYDLPDAIRDGWLVPIQQRAVYVEKLDLSSVRTNKGDFNETDLARVMEYEESLHGIASPTMDLVGNRKTLVFAASVEQARRLTQIFNRYKDCACFVHGETPKEERRNILREYALNHFQFLVNVGIATEGFDDPGIEVVVMGRPTKSRALYAQMAGRGTRPLPGVVDFEPVEDGLAVSPEEQRRIAIAASGKPFVEIIDFVGNAGRHRLITSADILGGKYQDDVVERAAKKAKEAGKPVDMLEALDVAAKEIEDEKEAERRKVLKFRAHYKSQVIDPFEIVGLQPWQERGWNVGRVPSDKQLAFLEKSGIAPDQVKTFTQATQLIDTIISRRGANQCTFKQAKILAKYGYDTKVTFQEASGIIDAIAKNGWRRSDAPPPPPPAPRRVPVMKVY